MRTSGTDIGNNFSHTMKLRLVLLLSGLSLVWVSYFYCSTGSQNLLILTSLIVALSIVFPGMMPNTSRSKIWTYVIVLILCLSANVERLGFTGGSFIAQTVTRTFDRIATFAFAAGLTSLFFNLEKGAFTSAAISIIPMLGILSFNLHRSSDFNFSAAVFLPAFALLLLSDQLRRAIYDKRRKFTPHELVSRVAVLIVWFSLTAALLPSVINLGMFSRDTFYKNSGFKPRYKQNFLRSSTMLSLGSPGEGFFSKYRVLMEIKARNQPEYLREAVFKTYSNGQWTGRSSESEPPPLSGDWSDEFKKDPGKWVYHSVNDEKSNSIYNKHNAVWDYKISDVRLLTSLCLPMNAVSLAVPDGIDVSRDGDGIVSATGDMRPTAYSILVDTAREKQGYMTLRRLDNQAYMDIPTNLSAEVSSWAQDVLPDSETMTIEEIIDAVGYHFQNNFSYHLAMQYNVKEPLSSFMENKHGHCTLFASVTTLLFRNLGIPARMVSGYYCSELHPYTGMWVVRERDAHAWCEVWDAENECWILVETTPPSGRPDTFGHPGKLRMYLETAGFFWHRFINILQEANPLIYLADSFESVFSFFKQTSILVPTILIAVSSLLIILGLKIFNARKLEDQKHQSAVLRKKLARTMEHLGRTVAPRHLYRNSNEPWASWWERVKESISPERSKEFEYLLNEYQKIRYMEPFDLTRANDWLKTCRQLKSEGIFRKCYKSPKIFSFFINRQKRSKF
jgi:hypothetical protein